jgi:signal transduction histidine kinase
MEEEVTQGLPYVVAMASIAVTCMVGAVLVFFILYQKRMIRHIEEKRKLQHDHQKDLLSSFIETQEKERSRIAADLHDGIGASLAGIKLMLSQFKPENEKDILLLQECKDAIQKTASSAREISHDLLPPALEKLGLIKTLERMARNFSAENLTVKVEHSLTDRLVSNEELALFRITQELLNNTLKYAQASNVFISIHAKEGLLEYEYWDNGIGFEHKDSIGLGLKNIESRIQMIKGELQRFSTPRHKTGICIKLWRK